MLVFLLSVIAVAKDELNMCTCQCGHKIAILLRLSLKHCTVLLPDHYATLQGFAAMFPHIVSAVQFLCQWNAAHQAVHQPAAVPTGHILLVTSAQWVNHTTP